MKNTHPFYKAVSLVLALVLVFSVTPSVNAAESAWTLKDDTEIYIVKNSDSDTLSDALAEQVKLFTSELAEKVTKTALPINYGDDSDAGANDIVLVLDSSLEIAAQGYVVKASDSSIKISASDADGLFYGCRHLIKELLLDGTVVSSTDAPDVLERAVSLDNGRKYYTVDWIKEFIREMSWANMNALALHFSEEMGLGIESKLYPWLNGRDGTLCTQAELVDSEHENFDAYLTQEEVKEIVEYAKLYHVEIIPSLDSPGHMNYIVKLFNEKCADEDFSFTYDGVTYTAEAGSKIGNYFSYNGTTTSVVPGSRNGNYSRGIDVSNEVAVAFTKSLIEEYATLFAGLGCTKFDIGGDELLGWGSAISSSVNKWEQLDHWKAYAQERTGNSNAVAYDAFLLYMNDLNALVRELGYTSVRMWNDDALRSTDTGWTGVVELDTDIDIWFWSTGENIFYDYASAGYQLYNIISDYNYYAMTDDYFSDDRGSFAQAYPGDIYNEWTPYVFYPANLDAGWKYNPSVGNPNVLGGAFGIWCDNPTLKTEDEVMEDLLPLIRANAAKSWDALANDSVDYTTYTSNWEAIGNAPAGTVIKVDFAKLTEAVNNYSEADSGKYTAESFTAYTEAVTAGKALLKYVYISQNTVDTAVAAIEAAKAALKEKPTVDKTALEAAIVEYETTDATPYTSDSFANYTAAVNKARTLIASDTCTEGDVNTALEAINTAKNALKSAETVDTKCFISGSFKSSRVYVGKVATLNMSIIKGSDIKQFEIFNDVNAEIEIVRQSKSTKKSDRDNYCIIFKANEEMVGSRTFTIFAVDSNGDRYSDSLTLTLNVK